VTFSYSSQWTVLEIRAICSSPSCAHVCMGTYFANFAPVYPTHPSASTVECLNQNA